MVHVFLLGPTAAGKSAVALALARDTGATIANVDAFQVYRGLDIGTGKPTDEERRTVPHALFDLVGATDDFNVADYQRHASAWLESLGEEVSPVVWVGGTGLYYRVLRQGLSAAPATDPGVRGVLEALPLGQLQEEVRRVDPAWAAEADLSNSHRVLRALAVFRQTGRPLSAWHQDPLLPLVPEASAFILIPPTDLLRQQISRRVRLMWEAGWPEEVGGLMQIPGWEQSSSARALGYTDVAEWCRNGGDVASTCERIATRTWQYARRQLTWFRRERNLHCIEMDARSEPSMVARSIRQALPLPPS